MISVITVSNRYGGIDINWSSLRRQTFKTFEWVLCDTLYEERKEALQHYTKFDRRVKHIKQGAKDMDAKTWLNHAENQAIKASSGELIVLLQDYIHIEPDALEKFWGQYQDNPRRLVSGVGCQYQAEPVTNPKGLITVFKEPFEKKPTQVVWQDPRMRKDQGSFYASFPNDIEFNFCAVPRQAFYDVGGCDEEYDKIGHAFDNCSVAQRAFMLGYETYLDQSNESFSINSDAWDKSKAKTNDNFIAIATFHQQRMRDIAEGKYPLRYPYLD